MQSGVRNWLEGLLLELFQPHCFYFDIYYLRVLDKNLKPPFCEVLMYLKSIHALTIQYHNKQY